MKTVCLKSCWICTKNIWGCVLSMSWCSSQAYQLRSDQHQKELHLNEIRQLSTAPNKSVASGVEQPSTSKGNLFDVPLLKLKKVALMGKMTRYEFEKMRYDGYNEQQFKEELSIRGSNYDVLLYKHKQHIRALNKIIEVLKRRGIEYQICTRGHTTFTKDVVEWADAVITAGGDGTFLSAASKITNKRKPLIGLNTDPQRSEGHLCLPAKYSNNLDQALDKIADGKFKWLQRQRIRITMTGTEANFQPLVNGEILKARMKGNTPAQSHSVEHAELNNRVTKRYSETLPILALNEVFIGEALASVPSYYELQIDGGSLQKQKSSGLCVSTGTGSTAWSFNICRLHPAATEALIKVVQDVIKEKNKLFQFQFNQDVIDKVTDIYANSFVFDANEMKMLYSIRDAMCNKVYHCENPHGWAKEILIRSRCWDAYLCIDGDTSFVFNDGATVVLEVLPEDSLRTVVLEED